MGDARWRWEWAGTPAAANVPPWMRTGHGLDGSRHAVVLFLARMRESVASGDPDWAFRPLDEIMEFLGDRPLPADGLGALLGELAGCGVAEPDAHGGRWRATPTAVEAIAQSYADRDPLTDDEAAPRRV